MNDAQQEFLASRDREAAAAARERDRIEGLWPRLQDAGRPSDWKKALDEDPSLVSWAFCEKLCHESAAAAEGDAERAGELMELALEVAFRVAGDEVLRCRVQEYVWMHVGNVLRARGDLTRAEEAFAKAKELFVGGIVGSLPSPFERGRLQALEAAFARDRGHLAEAVEKLDFGLRLMDAKSPARAVLLLDKGRLHRRLGQPAKALEELAQALDLVARSSDPRLAARLRVELGCVLCDLGRFEDFEQLAGPYRQAVAGFPVEEARFACLQGRLAAGLGRVEEAEEILRQMESRPEVAVGSMGDMAVLALELGALYARQGRTAELRSLAEPILRLAARPGLSRESKATLKLFGRLAADEKLTAERAARFVQDLARSSGQA